MAVDTSTKRTVNRSSGCALLHVCWMYSRQAARSSERERTAVPGCRDTTKTGLVLKCSLFVSVRPTGRQRRHISSSRRVSFITVRNAGTLALRAKSVISYDRRAAERTRASCPYPPQNLGSEDPPGIAKGSGQSAASTVEEVPFNVLGSTAAVIRLYGGDVSHASLCSRLSCCILASAVFPWGVCYAFTCGVVLFVSCSGRSYRTVLELVVCNPVVRGFLTNSRKASCCLASIQLTLRTTGYCTSMVSYLQWTIFDDSNGIYEFSCFFPHIFSPEYTISSPHHKAIHPL